MPAVRRSVLLAVLLVAAAAACAPGGGDATAERTAVVKELRAAVGEPAGAVGTAAATLVRRLEELHAAPPADPDARRTAVATVRDRDLAGLREAADRLDARRRALPEAGPDLASGADTGGDREGPPTVAARTAAALDAAVAAAEALATAAARDLDVLAATADADARLFDLVATWEERGPRSQQLQRLADTATAAEALAAELEASAEVPACAGAVGRRVDAAAAVAAHSRELRDLVARRAGEAFDARRDELRHDPFGLGARLADLDADDLDCWRRDSPVAAAGADVEAALEAVEAALNPGDPVPSAGSAAVPVATVARAPSLPSGP